MQHAVDVNEAGVATVRHEQPVATNTEIEVTLNWYAPDRQVPAAVAIESALTFPSERVVESPQAQSSPLVDRIVKLAGGAVLVEFEAEPGRRYEGLYSDDGQVWKRALATPNAGAANRVQWLDQGSPATWPHPGDVPMRLYRFRPIAR